MTHLFPQLNKKGQNLLEYSTLLILVMSGIIIMGPYVIRSWNAHVKGWEDSVSDSQQDPLEFSNSTETEAPECTCRIGRPVPPCASTDTSVPCCGTGGCGETESLISMKIYEPRNCIPLPGNDCPSAPPSPLCETNSSCCTDWTDVGCGSGTIRLPVPRVMTNPDGTTVDCSFTNQLLQKHQCGNLSGSGPTQTWYRCIDNHTSCTFACEGSLPDFSDPAVAAAYGPLCAGDDTGLTKFGIDYSYINQGTCDDPVNRNTKCQYECKEPFVPLGADESTTPPTPANRCDCPLGSIRDGGICKCGGYISGCSNPLDPHFNDPNYVDVAGCPADHVKNCTDIWNCCGAFSSVGTWHYLTVNPRTSIPAGERFYEDTDGSWVGSRCPAGMVMFGVVTQNYGKGGHNDWYIKCRELPTTCFVNPSELKYGKPTGGASGSPIGFPATPPASVGLSYSFPPVATTFYEDTEGSYVGQVCDLNHAAVGLWTTNRGKGGHNYWYIECAQMNPTCFDGHHEKEFGNFYSDTEGHPVGADTQGCYLMTGIRTINTGKGGHNWWTIKGMK